MDHPPLPSGPPLAVAAADTHSARLGLTWAALHEAADTIVRLAGREPAPMPADVRNFPAAIREAGGWRLNLAEQGVADLAALMAPGLAALLQVSARRAEARAAADALWQEFVLARDGLVQLLA